MEMIKLHKGGNFMEYNLEEALAKKEFPDETKLHFDENIEGARNLITGQGGGIIIAEPAIISESYAKKLEEMGFKKGEKISGRYGNKSVAVALDNGIDYSKFEKQGFKRTPVPEYPDNPKEVFELRFRCDCGELFGRDFYDPRHEKRDCWCSKCGSWVTFRDDYPKQ